MTQPSNSYSDAIEHLDFVLHAINQPGVGLGSAWGLQRGQAGYFVVLKARNELERLRDEMQRLEESVA